MPEPTRYPTIADHPRISIDPAVMVGKPCIRGTRIPVHMLLEQLAAGDTVEEIVAGYPRLTPEDIAAALAYAATALRPVRLPEAAE